MAYLIPWCCGSSMVHAEQHDEFACNLCKSTVSGQDAANYYRKTGEPLKITTLRVTGTISHTLASPNSENRYIVFNGTPAQTPTGSMRDLIDRVKERATPTVSMYDQEFDAMDEERAGVTVDANGKRSPCERCGCRLYFHEQHARFCRLCAEALVVLRLLVRP